MSIDHHHAIHDLHKVQLPNFLNDLNFINTKEISASHHQLFVLNPLLVSETH